MWQRYVDGPRGWAICKSTLKAGRNEGTHGGERASFRIEYSVRFVLKDLMFLRVYKTKIVSAGCHRFLGSCVVYSCRSPSPLSITTGLAVSRSPRLYVHAPVCRGCAGNGCSQTRSRLLASPTPHCSPECALLIRSWLFLRLLLTWYALPPPCSFLTKPIRLCCVHRLCSPVVV